MLLQKINISFYFDEHLVVAAGRALRSFCGPDYFSVPRTKWMIYSDAISKSFGHIYAPIRDSESLIFKCQRRRQIDARFARCMGSVHTRSTDTS